MVKLAENKMVDLDVLPGNKQGDQLAQQTRDAVQGKLPPEEAQGAVANAQAAAGAVSGTLGGGVKGVVDTAGNTVGSLAQGLQGTVQGVGDGLGSTVQFAGGTAGAGIAQGAAGAQQLGTMAMGAFGGNKSAATEGGGDHVTASEQVAGSAEQAGDKVGQSAQNVGEEAKKGGEEAEQKAAELAGKADEGMSSSEGLGGAQKSG